MKTHAHAFRPQRAANGAEGHTETYDCNLTSGIRPSKEFAKKGLAQFAVNVGLRCGHDCTYCSSRAMLRCHPIFKVLGKKAFETGYAIVDPDIVDKVAEDAERLQTRGLVQLCTTVARALGSRITTLEHEPSDDEIAAFMRQLASKGYKDLYSNVCLEVAEFVISETRNCEQRLDLRHLTKAWEDYRQFKDGKAKTPWQELVRTSLRKLQAELTLPLSKHDEIDDQRKLVQKLIEKYPNNTKKQLAESRLGKSTFYARRRELLT
jgi:hypothetical protein